MDELPPLFAAGQRLGRYELLQRLAVGGMAEIYLARTVGPADFEKLVVIKRLLPQHALDPQLLRMFLDEARLMARLNHPNVPQVYDVSDAVEVPYFAMEHVPGPDLRAAMSAAAEEPLELGEAVAVAVAVAAGLHHAHEQRGADDQPLAIVHRDISPSNVLLSVDGAVKITDFGVAKWAHQRSLTDQGQLKGKLAHMSPEQCRGALLDRRSDVFALGILLYEITTGRLPFSAPNEYDLLRSIMQADVSPPDRPGGYPPALAAIVLRALGKNAEDRQPTAQALQRELESFAHAERLVVSGDVVARLVERRCGERVAQWRRRTATAGRVVAAAEVATGARARTATRTDVAPVAPGPTGEGRPGKRGRGAIVALAAVGGIVVTVLGLALARRGDRSDGNDRAEVAPRAIEATSSATAKTKTTTPSSTSPTGPATAPPTPSASSPAELPKGVANVLPTTALRSPARARPRAQARAQQGSARAVAKATADPATPSADNARQPATTADGEDVVRPTSPSSVKPSAVKVWDPDSPIPP